jgi:hypothetical protein
MSRKRWTAFVASILVLAGCASFFIFRHYAFQPEPRDLAEDLPPSVPFDNTFPLPAPTVDQGAVIPKPGGISCKDRDLIKEAYPDFDMSKCREEKLDHEVCGYIAYRSRKDGKIYWTKKKVCLKKGERIITDGKYIIRVRCGNEISATPQTPTELVSPTQGELETPVIAPLMPTPSGSTPPETVFSPPGPGSGTCCGSTPIIIGVGGPGPGGGGPGGGGHPVPEPGALLLLIAGVLSLILVGIFRKARKPK